MRSILSLYLSYIKTSIISMLIAAILLILYAGVTTGNLSPVFGITFLIGIIIATYLQIRHLVSSRKSMSAHLEVEQTEEASNRGEAKIQSSTKQTIPVPNKTPKEAVPTKRDKDLDLERLKRQAAELEKK